MIKVRAFPGKVLAVIECIKYMSFVPLFIFCSCDQGTTVQNKSEIKKTYYPNGQLKELTAWEEGVMHGPFEGYFANGNLNYKGRMLRGKKKGTVKYYDSVSGKVTKWVNYVVLADTSASYPNETIYFQKNGKDVDTTAPNLYYKIGVISDTVRLHDSFFYSIKLHHPYFSRHKVYICDFDNGFHLFDIKYLGYGWMENKEFHFVDVPDKLGENYIRGYIDSDSATNPNESSYINKHTLTFFEKKYYVIP